MADSVTFEMDTEGVAAALLSLGDAAQPYVNDASRESARAIDREATSRLERQLGSNATGKTVEGIIHEPAYDGNGYIVAVERDPYPMLPIWLEKGTKPGDRPNKARVEPRPFFYVSTELEQAPHFRRIEDAVSRCIADKGIGG